MSHCIGIIIKICFGPSSTPQAPPHTTHHDPPPQTTHAAPPPQTTHHEDPPAPTSRAPAAAPSPSPPSTTFGSSSRTSTSSTTVSSSTSSSSSSLPQSSSSTLPSSENSLTSSSSSSSSPLPSSIQTPSAAEVKPFAKTAGGAALFALLAILGVALGFWLFLVLRRRKRRAESTREAMNGWDGSARSPYSATFPASGSSENPFADPQRARGPPTTSGHSYGVGDGQMSTEDLLYDGGYHTTPVEHVADTIRYPNVYGASSLFGQGHQPGQPHLLPVPGYHRAVPLYEEARDLPAQSIHPTTAAGSRQQPEMQEVATATFAPNVAHLRAIASRPISTASSASIEQLPRVVVNGTPHDMIDDDESVVGLAYDRNSTIQRPASPSTPRRAEPSRLSQATFIMNPPSSPPPAFPLPAVPTSPGHSEASSTPRQGSPTTARRPSPTSRKSSSSRSGPSPAPRESFSSEITYKLNDERELAKGQLPPPSSARSPWTLSFHSGTVESELGTYEIQSARRVPGVGKLYDGDTDTITGSEESAFKRYIDVSKFPAPPPLNRI